MNRPEPTAPATPLGLTGNARVCRTALAWATAAVLAGCQTVEPMDHPFQQVPVAASSASGTGGAAAAEEARDDDRFAEFDEPFTLSSEEMGVDATPPDDDAELPASDLPDDLGADAEAAVAAAPQAAPQEVISAVVPRQLPPAAAQVPAAPLGWAIRLVSTIPEAQPPRAILGLPSGEEIVVSPGSMVPEAGLVVLSIGPQGVQLARVEAAGDHAKVAAINLTPQY